MSRDNALIAIAHKIWDSLSDFDKTDILSDYHFIVSTSIDDLHEYYSSFKYFIVTDSVLLEIYSHKFRGVRNEYIKKLLSDYCMISSSVEGEVEFLCVCDCCGFRTFDCDYGYSICRACGWPEYLPSTLLETQKMFASDPDKLNLAKMMFNM